VLAAKEFIYKKHEEWINNVDEFRRRRIEQIQRKMRK